MNGTLRLLVAQSPAELIGPAMRLDWLATQLQAHDDADLILLPELFLTGYHIGNKIADYAEPATGVLAGRIAALARAHKIAIHYGYGERDGDKLYNAAQIIGPDGSVLGGYRKHMLPPGFERDLFSGGKRFDLVTYCGFSIATLICYDAEFPELARHVARKGADLILVPTALGAEWEWVARQMIPTRAFENGVFLAYANYAGNENGMHYLGESFIAAPNGSELVRAGSASTIIHATLDHGDVAKAQTRLPYQLDSVDFKC